MFGFKQKILAVKLEIYFINEFADFIPKYQN